MILPTHSPLAAGPAIATTTATAIAIPPSSHHKSLFRIFSSHPDIDPENWSSLIGIITAIVGNVLISFALNMQRYAHIRLEREWQEKERERRRRKRRREGYKSGNRNSGEGYVATEEDPLLSDAAGTRRPALKSAESGSGNGSSEDERDGEGEGEGDYEVAYKQKSYLKSPYWWAGIILMTTGEAGNFLAYGFAPASIVSPLGVVALISNCIIAPFMLKEPFRKRDGLGVLVAVGGAVTVVLSASDNNPKLGPDEIWDLITRWEFETYLGSTVAVIAGLMVASNRFGDKSILIDLGLVGLFGGYTALSTKGVASMLSYTLWHAITFPVTYLLVATLVFTAIMQIKYINRALQRFDATQVIPVQFVIFTLSVILGSAILYRDFERTSGEDAGKFVGGCVLTFMGVWLITSGRPRRVHDDDEDREPESEDAINLVEERYHDEVDSGGDNDASVSSRRSSTIRASSPPVDIAGRKGIYNFAHTPASYGSAHRPDTAPSDLTPSPHTSTPWPDTTQRTPNSTLRRAPTPISRHSTPLLPSEATAPAPQATASNPELPFSSTYSTTTPLPRTPTRGISDPHLNPQTPTTLPSRLRQLATTERLGTSSSSGGQRTSIPGPLLASPLSTSLATMVADLKRGGSFRSPTTSRAQFMDGAPESALATASASTRRRESVLGIGASEVDEAQIGEPLDRRRTATDDVPSSVIGGLGRERTLGDIWRGWRGESQSQSQGQGDVERGVGTGGGTS